MSYEDLFLLSSRQFLMAPSVMPSVAGQVFLTTILAFSFISFATAQCPTLQPPCRCAPSIYEPVAIICENAGSLSNALQAIEAARDIPVSFILSFL